MIRGRDHHDEWIIEVDGALNHHQVDTFQAASPL